MSLELRVGSNFETRSWNLDTAHDDFERGKTGTYIIRDRLPAEDHEIRAFKIHKSPDHWYDNGGWKLGGIRIWLNDDPSQVLYENDAIEKWLEDDHRDWAPEIGRPGDPKAFQPREIPRPLPPPPLPVCTAGGPGSGTVDPAPRKPDRDCDGTPDDADPTDDPPDRDGDGVCDRCEDWNGNGVVDPGETDPDDPDSDGDGTIDGRDQGDLLDSDGDGLPDVYEDVDRDGVRGPGETDPMNPDSDGDGWLDGPSNERLQIVLTKIHCDEEQEDFGQDDLYPVVDDVRFPADPRGLDGVYHFDDGDDQFPLAVVARRVVTPAFPGPLTAVVELREDDFFDWTDDHMETTELRFEPTDGFAQLEFGGSDHRYDLNFFIDKMPFADPNPLDAAGDSDTVGPAGNARTGDGLSELDEFSLTRDLPVRGLADPERKDLFVELDATSKANIPEEYTKTDIVSQFYYHDIAYHLADNDSPLGGGGILGLREPISLRNEDGWPNVEDLRDIPKNFDLNRRHTFTYAVAADSVGGSGLLNLGLATPSYRDDRGEVLREGGRPCSDPPYLVFRSNYLDHVSDLESIVWFHETGHTLGLCHRPDDLGSGGNADRPPTTNRGCTKYRDPNHNDAVDSGEEDIGGNCTHYWVEPDSDTAMGTTRVSGTGSKAGVVVGGVAGAWGGVPGVILGAALGGFLGGRAPNLWESVDREINYEDAEWQNVDLKRVP